MIDNLSNEDKLGYIHHWETQAGRILRMSVTILGVIISAASVFITLIVTSNQVTIPENPVQTSFNPLVSQMSTLPILGEPTAAVLVFLLTTSTVILATIALITIFVLAPLQSLEVMDTSILTENPEEDGLEALFTAKKENWHLTVVFFKYGVISLIFSILFSIPVFVIRNARLATATIFVLAVIALMIIRHYYSTIIYYLWNSSKLDILHPIGGIFFLIAILARPNPDSTWDFVTLGTLGLPLFGGIIRGFSLQYEQAERYVGREAIFVSVFGLGALPTLLIVSDLINADLGAILFFVMITIGIVSGASIVGMGAGLIGYLLKRTLAGQKSKLTSIRELFANLRGR